MVSREPITSLTLEHPKPGHDVTLTAYKRLQQLEGASTSTLHIRKSLQSLSPSAHFIPFIQERDQLGHLLSPASSLQSESCQQRSVLPLPQSLPSLPLRSRLLQVTAYKKVQFPSVGTYSPRFESWLPKSFSTHKLPGVRRKPLVVRVLPSKQADAVRVNELVPSFQYSVKRRVPEPKPKDRFDLLRPEAALNAAKKTNFQSVRLEESPEGLSSTWQWPAKRLLKEEKLRVLKEVMNQLRSGQLFL